MQRRYFRISLDNKAYLSEPKANVSMQGLSSHTLKRRHLKTILSITNHRQSTIITTIKARPLCLIITHLRITVICMPGLHIHSGLVGSGSRGSSVSTIFKESSFSMGTEDLFRTIFGILGRGDWVELILEEDIWEMPWQIYPIQQEDLPPIQPPTERLQF